MSTRHVRDGERRRQNGWASAPEYDVLRGINGTAVAFKAALQEDAKQRELLFALQALSHRDGGAKRIARELLEMFPERIGTPTMLKIGCKPGQRLSAQQTADIFNELVDSNRRPFSLRELFGDCDSEEEEETHKITAAEFCQDCLQRCKAALPDFIEELCCDPKMQVAGTVSGSYKGIVAIVLDDARRNLEDDPKLAAERPDLRSATSDENRFRAASLPYFHDVLGALHEYVMRLADKVPADFVETGTSKIVFDAFHYVLETGRSALVEGPSGSGKTTALKACAEMYPGRCRYLQLSGITSRTAFLRRIADVCGVASGGGMSTDRIQTRVEAFLKRTKLALLIDEGQYLWPQGKRITSHPELVNWLNTSLYNECVPFLISATRQFTERRKAIEQQTDWSSEQARRRIRRVFRIPDLPLPGTTADWHAEALARITPDLMNVAHKQIGELGDSAVEYVVGYARTSRGYFQAITDAIDDARIIARRAGRDRITFKDLRTAIVEWRGQSDDALQRVFDTTQPPRRKGRATPLPPAVDPEETQETSPLNPALKRSETLTKPSPNRRHPVDDLEAVLTG